MNVSEIMRSPAPQVPPDTAVSEVARSLLAEGVAGIPVVGTDGEILGIVTQTDLVEKHMRVHGPLYLGILGSVLPIETRRTHEELRHVLAVSAAELMSDDAVQLPSATDVDDVATVMVDRGADTILVVDDGRLVGLVDRTDVIRLLVREESDALQPG